jgi:hypothetical protein
MLIPIVVCLLYVAFNVYLWALPISHLELFLITGPLGIAYFWLTFRIFSAARRQ